MNARIVQLISNIINIRLSSGAGYGENQFQTESMNTYLHMGPLDSVQMQIKMGPTIPALYLGISGVSQLPNISRISDHPRIATIVATTMYHIRTRPNNILQNQNAIYLNF